MAISDFLFPKLDVAGSNPVARFASNFKSYLPQLADANGFSLRQRFQFFLMERRPMKTAKIPKIVTIRGQLFPGDYEKRKMKAKDLYCWFHVEAPGCPHASVEISDVHENWRDFHVTFPVSKQKGGWSGEDETEIVSYSVYVQIDDGDTVKVVRTTDSKHWKVTGFNPGIKGFADMDRKGLEFAREFYSAAFAQEKRD